MTTKVRYTGPTQHTRVLTAADQVRLGVPENQVVEDFVLEASNNWSKFLDRVPAALRNFLENDPGFEVTKVDEEGNELSSDADANQDQLEYPTDVPPLDTPPAPGPEELVKPQPATKKR